MTSDNAQNDGKWKNEEYDRLIDASKNADVNDPAKRWDDMVKAEKILVIVYTGTVVDDILNRWFDHPWL